MYLLAYNGISAILWLAILVTTIFDLSTGFYLDPPTGHPHKLLIAVQTVNAAMEIAHVAFGLVNSPLFSLLLQLLARLLITVGVSLSVPLSPGNYSLAYAGLSLAWSITEIIRYLFFAYKQCQTPPFWLLWLRYLSFVVMYPLGLLCEPIVVYHTLGYVSGPHYYFLAFGMTLYVPGFITLYRYMWRQRWRYLQ